MKQLEFNWTKSSVASPPSQPIVIQEDRDKETLLAGRLEAALQRPGKHPVKLVVTHNRRTMLSLRPKESGAWLELRAHRMFLDAPEEVIRALAVWVRQPRRRQAGSIIDTYIKSVRSEQPEPHARKTPLITRGEVYDLDALFSTQNKRYFDDTVQAAITWGKMPGKRRRRSIRFGSYSVEENLIRIHPLLDQAFVPLFFIEYIVYHEMLHAYVGVKTGPGGRRQMHGREFKRLEQAYPDYERAVAWMAKRANMDKLLRRVPL